MRRSVSWYLNRAFRDGERIGKGTIRVLEADPLVLPTGRVVVCDPTYLIYGARDQRAYTRTVPPGRYPVFVSLFADPTWRLSDDVVACAMVRFRNEPAARWEIALRPGEDPSTLKPGHRFCFGVDAGTACFADEATLAVLPDDQPAYAKASEEYMHRGGGGPANFDRFLEPRALGDLYEATYRLTRDGDGPRAVSGVIDPATGGNIVCFLSGIGDGCYPSYFGVAADGTTVYLVADFEVLVSAEPDTLTLPVPELVDNRGELTGPELTPLETDRLEFDWDPAQGKFEVRVSGTSTINDIRLENVRGPSAGQDGFWLPSEEGHRWIFKLDEPPGPAARLVINYTPPTGAP